MFLYFAPFAMIETLSPYDFEPIYQAVIACYESMPQVSGMGILPKLELETTFKTFQGLHASAINYFELG